MAVCFCGCGREIGSDRAMRAVNKQGRRTVGLLSKLDDARASVEGGYIKKPKRTMILTLAIGERSTDDFDEIKGRIDDDQNPFVVMIVEVIDELIAEGNHKLASWQNIVHGDEDTALYDPRGFKKDWESWGKNGMSLCRVIGVPISRAGALSGDL